MNLLALLTGILLALATCAPAYAGMSIAAGQGVHTHSDASTGGSSLGAHTVTGKLSSTKACASGFIRISPNFCKATDFVANTSLTTTACTATAAISGVSDANGVFLKIVSHVWTNNAVAQRDVNVGVFRPADTTCVTQVGRTSASVREFVATAAAVALRVSDSMIAESGTNGSLRVQAVTLCSGCSADIYVMGYFD